MFQLKGLLEKERAFTLLELLVVVAIIGLMSSIILVGIKSSQRDAEDQAIIRDLGQVRKEAESYYVENGSYEGICDSDGTLSEGGYFGELEKSIQEKQGEISCEDGSSNYAVSSSLQGGGYWCIDSGGTSKEVSSPVNNTSCPD